MGSLWFSQRSSFVHKGVGIFPGTRTTSSHSITFRNHARIESTSHGPVHQPHACQTLVFCLCYLNIQKMSPRISSSHRTYSAHAVLLMASENYASFWVWNDAPSHGLMYGSTEIRAGGRYGGGILEGNSWSLATFFPLTATLCFLTSIRWPLSCAPVSVMCWLTGTWIEGAKDYGQKSLKPGTRTNQSFCKLFSGYFIISVQRQPEPCLGG